LEKAFTPILKGNSIVTTEMLNTLFYTAKNNIKVDYDRIVIEAICKVYPLKFDTLRKVNAIYLQMAIGKRLFIQN